MNNYLEIFIGCGSEVPTIAEYNFISKEKTFYAGKEFDKCYYLKNLIACHSISDVDSTLEENLAYELDKSFTVKEDNNIVEELITPPQKQYESFSEAIIDLNILKMQINSHIDNINIKVKHLLNERM